MQRLPEELRREILSRLPVRSLLRFRCVSKSWLSLINDPDFRLAHLRNFKNNRDETHLLVVEDIMRDNPNPFVRDMSDKPKHCVVRCSNTFETSQETLITLPPTSMNGKVLDWKILGSIDGLVLLEMLRIQHLKLIHDLILWNPSIKKFHVIPSLPEREPILGNPFQEVNIGLGYDPLVKDYKLVKIIRINPNIPPLVAVYTVGVGSWKTSPIQGKDFSDFHWDSLHRQGAIYLGGSLIFIAVYLKRDAELVSFDLTRGEFFYSISIPDSIHKERWLGLFHSGCSSLILFDFRGEAFMWVLDIGAKCWTEPCSLNLPKSPNRILYLKKDRDILIWWAREQDFSRPTSHGFREYLLQLVTSYNLDSNEEKTLLIKGDACPSIFQVYGYMESLVLPK